MNDQAGNVGGRAACKPSVPMSTSCSDIHGISGGSFRVPVYLNWDEWTSVSRNEMIPNTQTPPPQALKQVTLYVAGLQAVTPLWTVFPCPPQGRDQNNSLPQLPLQLGPRPATQALPVRYTHGRVQFRNGQCEEIGLVWGTGSAGESGWWHGFRLSGALVVAKLNFRAATALVIGALVTSESFLAQTFSFSSLVTVGAFQQVSLSMILVCCSLVPSLFVQRPNNSETLSVL